MLSHMSRKKLTSQVTCIYISLYTIQIVSQQLYSDKQENNDLVMQTEFKFF